jgi:hypothetical protein
MFNLIIFEEIGCPKFSKILKILLRNKNLSSNICPQTGFSQFLSLSFENSAARKITLFSKRSQKIKNNFGKKFFYEVHISIRRINVRKTIQIGDGHWSLGRFLQRTTAKIKCFGQNFKPTLRL